MRVRSAVLVVLLIAGAFAADRIWNDQAAGIWLVRKIWDVTAWMAFWR